MVRQTQFPRRLVQSGYQPTLLVAPADKRPPLAQDDVRCLFVYDGGYHWRELRTAKGLGRQMQEVQLHDNLGGSMKRSASDVFVSNAVPGYELVRSRPSCSITRRSEPDGRHGQLPAAFFRIATKRLDRADCLQERASHECRH